MYDFETGGFPHKRSSEMALVSGFTLEMRGFESDVGDFEDADGEAVVFIFSQSF